MKKLPILLLALFIGNLSYSQDCDKLLEGGLYSFTTMTNTGSFNKDLRTYYLSEQFKTDMKSGKWGASLTIPIKGVPFSLGMDDSEDKYSELRTKLLEVTELNISQAFYQTSYSSIPNTNLYEAYIKCVNGPKDKTGFIQGLNIETEETVVFTIYYRPQSPNDPMPIVKSFNVTPPNSIISGNLNVGDKLNGYSLLITCKKHEERDLVLTLETDRGAFSSKASAIDNISSSKELPIGTIITSYLNFEQFNVATKNNDKSPGGIWTSKKSKWSPCDGRPVPESKFQKLTSQTSIPDLRGMFVRGLNQFDPNQPVPQLSSDKSDPDSRVVGSYQPDGFEKHNHTTNTNMFLHKNHFKKGARPSEDLDPGGWAGYETVDTDFKGITETRPNNIAVYYYIKIN